MDNRKSLGTKALSCGVPPHTIPGLVNYILDGIEPGSFLTAVLENDLMEAIGRADATNALCLPQIAAFIYNYAPSGCHGSPKKVANWLAKFSAGKPA